MTKTIVAERSQTIVAERSQTIVAERSHRPSRTGHPRLKPHNHSSLQRTT
jgi:hypothetical protein